VTWSGLRPGSARACLSGIAVIRSRGAFRHPASGKGRRYPARCTFP